MIETIDEYKETYPVRLPNTSGQSSHGRTLQNQPQNLEKQLEAKEVINELADTRPVGSGHELTKVSENIR